MQIGAINSEKITAKKSEKILRARNPAKHKSQKL